MRRRPAPPATPRPGRRPADERQHLLPGLAERSEHVVDERLVGRLGAAHPHSQPPEVARSQGLLQAAQAVVPSQTLPFLEADIAEGQLDLVVDHKHPLHGDLVPAGRLGRGPAGEVHEGRGQEQRPLVCPAMRPLGGEALEPGAERRETVAAAQLLAHHEAHVVAMELVLRPGIAQGDDAGRRRQLPRISRQLPLPRELLLALGAADDLGLGDLGDLGGSLLDPRRHQRDEHDLGIVQDLASRREPSRASTDRCWPICSPLTSSSSASGMSEGRARTVTSRCSQSSTPPSATPAGVPTSSMATGASISTARSTSCRSTWSR